MLPPSPASQFQATLCKLHMHAVLPALKDLCELSLEAKALAKKWNCVLKLTVKGGPRVILISKGDGKLQVVTSNLTNPRLPKTTLTLYFSSDLHLNQTFLGKTAPPPFPFGAPWRFRKIQTFVKLTKILESYLRPKPDHKPPEGFESTQTKLLLRIATNAIPIIGSRDTFAHDVMAHTPSGYAEFQVQEWGSPVGWIYWNKVEKKLVAGSGALPNRVKADVSIVFKNQQTVANAISGLLDNHVAIGLGNLHVHGLIPLADSLGAVMDRVDLYLPRESDNKVTANS